MDIVDPRVETYMGSLLERYDEPVLLEMEAEGRERGFPIIGRLVGVTVELLARSVGARRVFELGSGFGYSAYWFSRAVGPGGEVHCTDGDPANEAKALAYLDRAGLGPPIRWHVGDAVTNLAAVDGAFDVIYDDIDKVGYPDAWRAAAERIRVGGLYLCDNVLWSGAVADPEGGHGRDRATTEAILEHNRLIAGDERYVSGIVPTRDGLMVALRVV
ncbi:MAG TPA: O-methyltransferase [Actinomycetota bacterium]|jgi:predicted O-methyltransferase YrrM|nr:O-methyltransferase [Actinomycetota bacterium]